MADIMIRGMEMPTAQRIEVLIFKNGFVVYYDAYGHCLGQARATQLPEGHGDLVDAKELLNDKEGLRIFRGDFRLAFDRIIERANTVVPAEGGGEDG